MAARTGTAVVRTIAVFSAFPFLTGVLSALAGPARIPGGAPTPPSVDNAFRYANLSLAAAGPALWWTLLRPAERAVQTRSILGWAVLCGLTRVASWARAGRPHPVFVVSTVLELGAVPVLIAWHRRELPPQR